VEIVKNWTLFEEDPQGMHTVWHHRDQGLAEKILQARALLPDVTISDELLMRIAKISIALDVDGHRSDLIMTKASKTMAGFNGKREVQTHNVDDIIEIVLIHRMRRRPFEEIAIDPTRIEDLINKR
jgi:magnesium chelatase subunit I